MLRSKTLAIIFAAVALTPVSAWLAGGKLTSHCAEAERKSIFEKAEAYSSVTERLFYRNAISRETYHIRQGYFMACMDENQAYWKELQSGDRDGIRFEKEIFRQACNLGR